MPKGVPLTEAVASMRRREILDAAVKLFLEKGFQKTSMREIAEVAGTGKSTLYDYFQTKEQLLAFIFEDAISAMNAQTRAIAEQALPPDVRLRQIMQAQLAFVKANTSLNLQLRVEAQYISAEAQRRLHELRWENQDLLRRVITEGIAAGRFRLVDGLLTARMLADTLVTVLYTSRPTGSAEQMLEEVVEIILRGISQ